MLNIKKVIKKIVYKERYDGESYVTYLRKKGAKIGKNCFVNYPRNTVIDETRPWLVNIGDDVSIASGVSILTHGYDLAVLRKYYGELYGSSGKITIGNNVFIGAKATILKGVTIGDNVIIGANSLVNKDIPNNCVAAGNPCKMIMTLEEYRNKRKREYVNEAKELALEYYNTYKKKPDISKFHEFFPIMLERKDMSSIDFKSFQFENFKTNFINSEPIYKGLDEFLKELGIE